MLLSWYKDINKILKEYQEFSIVYLCSNHLDIFKNIIKPKNYGGVAPQLIRFCYQLLCRWKPIQSCKHNHLKYFILISSYNQLQALKTTLTSFKKNEDTFTVIVSRRFIDQETAPNCLEVSLSTGDILKTMVLAILHTPSLYTKVKSRSLTTAHCYYTQYLWMYAYLVYFHRVLNEIKPTFVITANDLNTTNRAMLAVAHYYGIKTAYLQHASVSDIFPPLRVNYAFLDGEDALKTYRDCEKNLSTPNSLGPKPVIILSGQKKEIRKTTDSACKVGIAINGLDDVMSVSNVIKILLENKNTVIIRWHPTQPIEDIKYLIKSFSAQHNVSFSDPIKEHVGEFLKNISYLISGNSSIHLEAALAGVAAIYYEFGQPNHPDYYGYVKNGLVMKADSPSELIAAISVPHHKFSIQQNNAIRYYSATYNTAWEGREGVLVAQCLIAISLNHELPMPKYSL